MPADLTYDDLLKRIDQKIDTLVQARKNATSNDKRLEAHDAVSAMRELKLQVLRAKEKSLAVQLGQIGKALRDEAAALEANSFKDAFDEIGALIGVVLGPPGRAVAPPGPNDDVADLQRLARDFLTERAGVVDELPEREPPPPTPPAVSHSSPTVAQRRLVAAIRNSADAHGLSPGLLGAVAFVESGFQNVLSDTSSAKGPFQFIDATWKGLVERFGTQAGIKEEDVRNVGAQAEMAARAFLAYRRTLADIGDEVEAAKLYLCHFLGPAAARACLLGDRSQPIDQALRAFYANKRLGAGFVDKIMDANPQLLEDGRPRTVNEVLEYYRARLLDGEARFQQFVEAEEAGSNEATPWLGIALAEKGKAVRELPGGLHDANILKYIASTTIGGNPKFLKDETPWCSAFVNWCITQAGLPGTNSAKARDWHDNGGWGRSIEEPVKGCIVVLWREAVDHPDRLGHVGFFDHSDGDNLFLLGGNQSDTINIAPYPRHQLLSFRMPV